MQGGLIAIIYVAGWCWCWCDGQRVLPTSGYTQRPSILLLAHCTRMMRYTIMYSSRGRRKCGEYEKKKKHIFFVATRFASLPPLCGNFCVWKMMRRGRHIEFYIWKMVRYVVMVERNARQNISTFDVFQNRIRHNGHMRYNKRTRANIAIRVFVCTWKNDEYKVFDI